MSKFLDTRTCIACDFSAWFHAALVSMKRRVVSVSSVRFNSAAKGKRRTLERALFSAFSALKADGEGEAVAVACYRVGKQ